jgi:PspAB-like protein
VNSVGLLDALLGRSKPVRPDLDRLFALPAAAVTLQAGADLVPTGLGSVCFASVEGGAFKQLQRDVRQLLDADSAGGPSRAEGSGGGIPVEFSQDEYGYTWLVARHAPEELGELVNDLHAVNTLLEENGFGPQLLCSLASFRSTEDSTEAESEAEREAGGAGARALALVYLYKRGTFYPFAPQPGRKEKRDSALELQIRGLLTDDLPVEPDLGRWFPVWGAPGL